jgi:hypothetical protein
LLLLVRHSRYFGNHELIVENLRLQEMAAGRAYETAYIMTRLKLDGATGSTIAPIAVR